MIVYALQTFEWMIRELRKLDTEFGMALTASVEKRINERRLAGLSTLQAYLENPQFLDHTIGEPKLLEYANKTAITTLIKDIYMRLFMDEEDNEEGEEEDSDEENSQEGNSGTDAEMGPTPPKRSRSNELREFKAARTTTFTSATLRKSTSSRVLAAIKSEMKVFETNGKRPEMLDKVSISMIKYFQKYFCPLEYPMTGYLWTLNDSGTID